MKVEFETNSPIGEGNLLIVQYADFIPALKDDSEFDSLHFILFPDLHYFGKFTSSNCCFAYDGYRMLHTQAGVRNISFSVIFNRESVPEP